MGLGGAIEEEEAEESSHSGSPANAASSNDSTDDSLLRELEALDCLSPDASSKAPSAFSQLMKGPLLHKHETSKLPQKRHLFPGKESAASPKSKRRKAGAVSEQMHQQPEQQPRPSETQSPQSDKNLLPDGSGRSYRLPTIAGRHSDLKSISGSTLSDLLDGFYADVRFRVVDSRYPYEYEGGHVRTGDNLYEEDAVQKTLLFPGGRESDDDASDDGKGNIVDVVIFHCEFSAERGPRMMRCLRSADRTLNACDYPKLRYPELYLLDGGYQRFFESFPRHCVPQNYVKMTDRNFAADMKKFRRKAKSMNVGGEMAAGGRPGMKRSRSIKF